MSTSPPEDTSDTPRKGRSNAILTYETVEGIKLGVQEALLGIRRVDERLHGMGRVHDDHEVRIRALELALAGSTASRGTATWIWQALWPTAAVAISFLAYLK